MLSARATVFIVVCGLTVFASRLSWANFVCSPGTYPAANEVFVWDSTYGDSSCQGFRAGEYIADLATIGWSTRISALEVGSAVRLWAARATNLNDVVMYEGGNTHTSIGSGLYGLGANVNNAIKSLQVTWKNSDNLVSLGNFAQFPNDQETYWSEEAQGLCAVNGNWFLARNIKRPSNERKRGLIYRQPVSASLTGSGTLVFDLNAALPHWVSDGWWHIGDIDCMATPFGDTLVAPIEGPGQAHRLIVFDVDAGGNLAIISTWILNRQDMAAWVAMSPFQPSDIWSSNGDISDGGGLRRYTIDLAAIDPNTLRTPVWDFDAPHLTDKFGNLLRLGVMQGGAFAQDGTTTLYLTNSGFGKTLRAFNVSNGAQIGESNSGSGLFRYYTGCAISKDCEPEGVAWLDLAAGQAPNIPKSQLHALILNNDIGNPDNVRLFHYSLRP